MKHWLSARIALASCLFAAWCGIAHGEEENGLFRMLQFHYENRVKAFRMENNVFQNVVLLGDSITEGFDVARHFPFRRVLNRGIGGDTIGLAPREKDCRGVLRRLDVSVYDCATSHVFLMIGTNDLGESRSLEQMMSGYRQIVEQIQARLPGVTLHIESLLPTRGMFAPRNEVIRQFNRQLQALAREKGCPYLDLHARMVDDKGELRAEFTQDGLHLTEPAYELWSSEIDKAMGW